MTRTVAQSAEILEFWFGTPNDSSWGQNRKAWWLKDAAFDDEVRARFLATHEAAARGDLDSWAGTAAGSLALLILLDQFPRNMFRGEARTYDTDAQARAVAKAALDQGFEDGLTDMQRMFLYMPFQHSERLDDQLRSLTLYDGLSEDGGNADYQKSAQRHYEIVVRFGRFPHRNVVLGRSSTEEELAFLKEPNSSF
jgi:uncharacterized protein (DUF924 family)